MKSAKWLSVGFVCLVAGGAGADDLQAVPTNVEPSVPCTPCADEYCGPRGLFGCKTKTVCAAPAKIVVHQATPIVEFRDDGPAKATVVDARTRPTIEDRAVRPVGDFLHHGNDCGCNAAGGGNFFKSKTKNYFQGVGAFGGAPMQFAPQMAMTAMPLQVQAYVPTPVQTYSVAAMPMQAMYAPAPVAPMSYAAPLGVPAASFSYAAPNTNADAATLALAQLFSAAANAPAPAARAQTATVANTNGLEERVTALEQKVQGIDARLRRIESKLQTLCAP